VFPAVGIAGPFLEPDLKNPTFKEIHVCRSGEDQGFGQTKENMRDLECRQMLGLACSVFRHLKVGTEIF
jgi:hypothetical protein